MPNPLNNVTCGDDYTDAATISDVWNTGGGWFVVSNASVFCELQYGVRGEWYWTLEQILGEGASGSVGNDCTGIRFRNAVSGQNAVVSGAIANGDEPSLGIINIGTINVTTSPSGSLLRTTVLTSGTTFTTGATTNQGRLILVGGGGGGANGGGAGNAGSGGGAGGYVDTGLIALTPSTAYTYAIGAAGVHGNAPTNGGDTQFVRGLGLPHQAIASGGKAGANGSGYTLGGAGGGATGGLAAVAVDGQQGGASETFNAGAYLIGGTGGSTSYGGGGGVGSAGGNGTDGSPGLIIIEEYS